MPRVCVRANERAIQAGLQIVLTEYPLAMRTRPWLLATPTFFLTANR